MLLIGVTCSVLARGIQIVNGFKKIYNGKFYHLFAHYNLLKFIPAIAS